MVTSLMKIVNAASRRVNRNPWWRLSDYAQQELAKITGVTVEVWRRRWERRLKRNAAQRRRRRVGPA